MLKLNFNAEKLYLEGVCSPSPSIFFFLLLLEILIENLRFYAARIDGSDEEKLSRTLSDAVSPGK